MGEHIDAEGRFQSDKYPWCQPDFVPLKVTDPMAQSLLWLYAELRESVDAGFAEDLRARLRAVGFHWHEPGGGRIFTCNLRHSAPRGEGWYWWVEGADDHMIGPFNTEAECHRDIYAASREADGR